MHGIRFFKSFIHVVQRVVGLRRLLVYVRELNPAQRAKFSLTKIPDVSSLPLYQLCCPSCMRRKQAEKRKHADAFSRTAFPYYSYYLVLIDASAKVLDSGNKPVSSLKCYIEVSYLYYLSSRPLWFLSGSL